MDDELIARIQRRADVRRTQTYHPQAARPPRYPPATAAVLSDAERRLGFPLPPFLAEVYLRVGNGGFGPGYGLIGLPGGHTGDAGGSIVELYESDRTPVPAWPTWQWPEAVVAFCEWGCAIHTCVDCRSGAVLTFDPPSFQEGQPMAQAFAQTHASVAAWFEDWVNGVRLWDKMFEIDPEGDVTITNPFTGEPTVIKTRRLRR
jgi:hypothetical protein